MSQSLAPLGLAGWSLIGTIETGYNPYYGYLADAQRSQVQENGLPLVVKSANADSSRTGQWDNSQGFIGVSNKTYGTLTVGRVNTLSLDAINSYDPMGGSYAFSPLGFSGLLRRLRQHRGRARQYCRQVPVGSPLSLILRSEFPRRRPGAMGRLRPGQRHRGLYQGQAGADFNLFQGSPYGGVLSMDFIGSWAKDVVNVGTFTEVARR